MKDGRPRRYDFTSPQGYADPAVGTFAGAIEELGLRFLDLIDDLPVQAMEFLPKGGANSVSMLGVHMIWAEAAWVARIAGSNIADETATLVGLGRQSPGGSLPSSSFTPVELHERWRTVHEGLTLPLLAGAADSGAPVTGASMTILQALMHLCWHWSYHSGQVGVLRRLWGEGYRWTFAE